MRADHLYIHVPFCARRCVYCDFSIAVRSRVPVAEYLQALEREWATRHRDSDFDLSTLYFGGGTPSKLGADGVSRLMEMVRRQARLRPDAEVTLEANPEDVSLQSARAWAQSGINRVSLGVQSFDDGVLRWMHRTHDANHARKAVHVLREAGLGNISIDLIFAVPNRPPGSWEQDLDEALTLAMPHVSVYGLTVESHTPLGRWAARRDFTESTEEIFENEFLLAHDRFSGSGFEHYEVSNYSKPGFHSRHNWAYWSRKPYGGLGPSAHEFDGIERRWNSPAYAKWLQRLDIGENPSEGHERLTGEQATAEEVYLNLRTSMGMPILDQERHEIERLVQAGWAATRDSTLRLTESGWLRLDSIASNLTQLRSRSWLCTYE